MMFSFLFLGSLGLVSEASADSTESSCSYTIVEAKPGWTAYKTTSKAAVSGSFTEYTTTPGESSKSIADAIQGTKMTIVPSSVDSGLELRNQTIATKYFAAFAPDTPFEVRVESVEGDNQSGTANLVVDINGKPKTLAFPYSVAESGELTAKSTMEMMDFGLKAAFDSIHKACEALHMGADGISKTWTDVELSITAKIKKTCD